MTSITANIDRLEKLVQTYYLQPKIFQMELDYMYLDAIDNAADFLLSMQNLFGGDLPQYKDPKWDKWAIDTKFPWRAAIAQVVVIALWEEYKLDCEIDQRIDEETAQYEADIANLSEDELMDRGHKKCKACSHILSWNQGDWFNCNNEYCSCSSCAVRVPIEN